MIVKARGSDQQAEADLCFTRADLGDVVPHEDDLVVISVVTVGRGYTELSLTRGARLM